MPSNFEKEFIRQIEKKLGLAFLENETEGNLCFVGNNEELQDDFKLYFTQSDLENFIRSFGGGEIRIPQTNSGFWERVEAGKN
jgi:hypothetical protein